MVHKRQKFATYFIAFAALAFLFLLEPVVSSLTGASCGKAGLGPLKLPDCTTLYSNGGELPEGVQLLAATLALAAIALSAAAAFELSKRE